MRLFRDLDHARLASGSVVTIGNFDGVHRGHQALLRRCREDAVDGLEAAVITFEPLPPAWFRPDDAPGRLTSPRQKLRLFAEAGMDLTWMMRFNRVLAELGAEAFVRRTLVDGLGARRIVVGDDFRFGRRREGDLDALRKLGAKYGFELDVVPEVIEDGHRVSSSAVRGALAAGDFDRAGVLLGRPWSLEGKVFRGSQLGRRLGYPTANMRLAARPCPIAGIFAVRARLRGEGDWLDGVANLGRRPAVGGGDFLVEVHVFDFDRDLYGRRLEVQFIEKLRDEANFKNLDALQLQMREDERRAREILQAPVGQAV